MHEFPINNIFLAGPVDQMLLPALNEALDPYYEQQILAPTLPHLLYHYTDKNGLRGILESARLWGTHFEYLNDTSELTYGISLVQSVAHELQSEEENPIARAFLQPYANHGLQYTNQLFIACFCTNGNSLPHWKEYGGGSGKESFSIGFHSMQILMNFADPDPKNRLSFHPVIYNVEEQKGIIRDLLRAALAVHLQIENDQVSEEVNCFTGEPAVLAREKLLQLRLLQFVVSFKDPEFSYEKEWRLCHFADLNEEHVRYRKGQFSDNTPYVELDPGSLGFGKAMTLPVKAIYCGPYNGVTSVDEVRALAYNRCPIVQVHKSELPVR